MTCEVDHGNMTRALKILLTFHQLSPDLQHILLNGMARLEIGMLRTRGQWGKEECDRFATLTKSARNGLLDADLVAEMAGLLAPPAGETSPIGETDQMPALQASGLDPDIWGSLIDGLGGAE